MFFNYDVNIEQIGEIKKCRRKKFTDRYRGEGASTLIQMLSDFFKTLPHKKSPDESGPFLTMTDKIFMLLRVVLLTPYQPQVFHDSGWFGNLLQRKLHRHQ